MVISMCCVRSPFVENCLIDKAIGLDIMYGEKVVRMKEILTMKEI